MATPNLPQVLPTMQEVSEGEHQLIILLGDLAQAEIRMAEQLEDFLVMGVFGLMVDEAEDAR